MVGTECCERREREPAEVLVPAVPPLSIELYAANVDRCDLKIGHHPDCLCFLLYRRGEEAGVDGEMPPCR